LLSKAKVVKHAGLKRFDYLIGTTAITGTDYNIPRSPLNPEQLVELLTDKKIINKKGKSKTRIALLFGREGIGLTSKEILNCDFVVAVPTSAKYPTLNISHAVSILLYELLKLNKKTRKTNEHIELASRKDKDIVLDYIKKVLNTIKFSTPDKKLTQKKVWKRIIGKSFLTKREAFAVIGFFKKVKGK